MKKKVFFRLLGACLALIFSLSLLTGCKSRPLTPTKDALREVGNVGGYAVYYEELYFLANAYKTEDMSEEQLWETVNENILTNYALLTLCEQVGVEYDEKQLEDDVQSFIDAAIESNFGDRSTYIDDLKASGRTDHYARFNAKVALLSDMLATSLAEKGELLTDENEVCNYIRDNFVRTWHFMLADNAGDDTAKNLADANEALEALRGAKTSMYKLIGGQYALTNGGINEDILIPGNGYTFARGEMEKAYENAAFALAVEEYSEVVTCKSELANGEYVDCHYVIQRLPLDNDFIKQNFSELYTAYAEATVAKRIEEVKSELTFIPNDFAKSLDITALEPVSVGTDTFAIVTVCIASVIVIGAAVTVILLVTRFKKKNAPAAKKAPRDGKGKEK